MIDLRHEVQDVRLAMLLIVDVGGGAVPPYDLALRVKQRRSAAEVPRVSFANRKQAVLHFIRGCGLPGAEPRFGRRPPIIGMNDPFPMWVADRSVSLAQRIGVFDAAVGSC